MKLALIDTLAAFRWARDNGYDVIVTDNPMLARDPAAEGRVLDGDAAVSQDEANRFGRETIALAERIDEALRAGGVPAALGLPAEALRLAGASSRVISTIVYRGLVAARAVATHRPEAIGIGFTDQPMTGSDGIALSRLHVPAVSLSEEGFFGALPVTLQSFPEPGSRSEADVPQDILRRSMHLPLSFLLLEAAQRLKLTRGRRDIFVLSENEALREALPHLAFSGARLRRLGKPKLPPSIGLPPAELPIMVAKEISSSISGLGLFDMAQAEAMARILTLWCARAVARVAADWPHIRKQMAGMLAGQAQPIVLTNGLFGPRGTLTYAALKAAGATVVDFEHGVTTGLSAHSQAKINFSEAATSDVVLCASQTAAKAFAEARGAAATRIEPIGLADQTRRLFRPRLQRRLSRQALGLASQETVIFHVSTWIYQGNLRAGFGMPTERFVETLERRLVEDVYGTLPHKVVFKPYPTERLAHHPPLEARLKLATNVSLSPPEDLRYLRAAADVLVTGVPTSTLGWIVGADVPVVWLGSRQVLPLISPEQDEEVSRSFLTVDIDREDWPERLRELLARPLGEIREAWAAKRQHRDAFYRRAITGPEGSGGRRAAAIIRELMREKSTS
ncbi:hypothetical protein GCM10007276_10780 [Agaricicola taiwanensis]|uniref:Uncharacterized protein n=1 Tax=Agaricicola taiwanensis TaxID=591372 RepID=A0A8J2YFW0_9RHOB|nr:hypothetical protein [Agaricicola taiwanensis]GGE35130.1 hypothetical protein GCM10007276_10780 [Agaricicola taiwanensis]